MIPRKMMMTVLRTKPLPQASSRRPSLRSTSIVPGCAGAASERIRMCALLMGVSSVSGFCEEKLVNALFELPGAAIRGRDTIHVLHLGLHPARMRRQKKDAVADLDGFSNGMGDEQN